MNVEVTSERLATFLQEKRAVAVEMRRWERHVEEVSVRLPFVVSHQYQTTFVLFVRRQGDAPNPLHMSLEKNKTQNLPSRERSFHPRCRDRTRPNQSRRRVASPLDARWPPRGPAYATGTVCRTFAPWHRCSSQRMWSPTGEGCPAVGRESDREEGTTRASPKKQALWSDGGACRCRRWRRETATRARPASWVVASRSLPRRCRRVPRTTRSYTTIAAKRTQEPSFVLFLCMKRFLRFALEVTTSLLFDCVLGKELLLRRCSTQLLLLLPPFSFLSVKNEELQKREQKKRRREEKRREEEKKRRRRGEEEEKKRRRRGEERREEEEKRREEEEERREEKRRRKVEDGTQWERVPKKRREEERESIR